MGGGRNKSKSKSKSKSKKTYSKAQQMAKNRIASGRTISQTKAANNKSMRDAAAARNASYNASRGKTTTSSASNKTSGIGPVASGSAYAKSLSTAKNQPSKKTSGVGPVASGKAYAAAVNSAKNAPTKKTSGVGPVADGAKYAQSLKISPPKTGGGDTKIASAFSAGSGLFGDDIDVGDGVFRTKDQIIKMRDNPQNFNLEPGSRLFKQVQEAGKGLVTSPTAPGTLVAANNLTGLAPKSTRFESATGSDAFAQSLGINTDVGGVNYGGLGSIREGGDFNPNANTSRTIRPTGNPNVMSPDGTFNRPGPGGPEPEADYTSYQPGSFYNQSDTNMNPTNFIRSARNVVTTPARMLGINNQFTNMLIPKSNEAIQDATDQRGPRAAVTRRPSGGGGARLPVAAALTPEEILLPEEVAPTEAPTYQQAGLDNNRLMQIQQEAYRQAYNPMTVGGFNPMFRFFGRRQGPRRGAFRRAFTRAA